MDGAEATEFSQRLTLTIIKGIERERKITIERIMKQRAHDRLAELRLFDKIVTQPPARHGSLEP